MESNFSNGLDVVSNILKIPNSDEFGYDGNEYAPFFALNIQ
jgi:hypothetical protein